MPSRSMIAYQIWDMKYRLKTPEGEPVDKSVEETWDRVARACSSLETDPARWTTEFRRILEDFRFLPGGRILAGAGSGRAVTLFNCFVMGTIPDSLDGIFSHLREAALTMQQGGGIGYDFSTIRPLGARVEGVGADASGPLSFMDVWDAMCRTIMSAGTRRGAMMGCLRCDHPDIEAFIEAKQRRGRLTMFNLSVLVTDAFMQAVTEDKPWPLRFAEETTRTISARGLWNKIMQSTYDGAEPGVIFIDRINQQNPLSYVEDIRATNPCGEQPLPPYGTCLLGSVNLTRLVSSPFEDSAAFDLAALAETVTTAVRLLDNVIDVSNYPLAAQRQEAFSKRRIGLGVTGLADALIMQGARYGSARAVALTEEVLRTIRDAAYRASVGLAQEKGSFPLFEAEPYLASPTISVLPEDIRTDIAKHGVRNALLTSIAPTGTISLFADNVSSGIEPVFSLSAMRRVLQPDGSAREEEVSDYAYRLFREIKGDQAPLTDAFVDVTELSPDDHLAMQAAAQKYVDSAISKTINLPETIPFDVFQDVYAKAYALGCKGCTTYRPNPITGAVLTRSVSDTSSTASTESENPTDPLDHSIPMDRPRELPGATYKLRWPESDHAIYITVNDIEDQGRRRPFEVFINSKNMEHYAWTVALTRMISAVFRRGGDVSFVVEELKAVFDPRGGQWMNGRYVPSLLAAIGEVIERHMVAIGFLDAPLGAEGGELERGGVARACPRCGQRTLIRQEGCDSCSSCGYSRCS